MSNGYLIATRILEALSGEKLTACLQALAKSEQGQRKMSSGHWDEGLAHSMCAHDLLTNIPEAAPILGIVKQDIAAAYGNLGNTTEATRFAQDAISLVQGVKELACTEAMARMTVGITCYRSGNEQQGKQHFASARSLLKNQPGSEQSLRLLDENEARLKSDMSKNERKWWQLW